MKPLHAILLILLVSSVFSAGCTGGSSGTAATATPAPSPSHTSSIVVEIVPETTVPLAVTPAVNVTTVTPLPTIPPAAELETGAKKQAYPYVTRSLSQFLYYTTYDGVLTYLKEKYADRPADVTAAGSVAEVYQQYSSDPVQKAYLDRFTGNIQQRSDLPQERARIAVSLIQHIPTGTSSGGLLPYEVLYYNKGSPADKSLLGACVLSGMGYGTALLVYPSENHVALGLKCPKQYSVNGSGYCYVETAAPAIMTYSNGTLADAGRMASSPLVIPVSEGQSFDQISEEYIDARSYDAALRSASVNSSGMMMDEINLDIYGDLRQKYGLYDLDLTRAG